MDSAVLVGWIANILTIIAASIALFGVAATWFSRPQLEVTAHANGSSGATIGLFHTKGSAPASNIFLGWGAGVGDDGVAMMGDGQMLWTSILVPGSGKNLVIHDPAQWHLLSPPREDETRLEIGPEGGFVAKVSWQRTMVPWLRTNYVVHWSNSARKAGQSPVVAKGRTASQIYESATRPPKI